MDLLESQKRERNILPEYQKELYKELERKTLSQGIRSRLKAHFTNGKR